MESGAPTQVVFDGHPLYACVEDEDGEDAYGNGSTSSARSGMGSTQTARKTEQGGES